MKSKFKNENNRYWRLKKKLLAVRIAQGVVVLAGDFAAYATNLNVADIFFASVFILFALFFAEQYYDAEIKRGE